MKVLCILLSFLFPFCIFSQNADYVKEMEENDLRIRQKPGSEGLLSDFLKSANMEEDTIYAILYEPAACFRCEAAIPSFYELLKKNNPKNKMLLISIYDDAEVAMYYNKKNNLKADYYLYDTESDYANVFSFNTGVPIGLYVMKLYPKSGVLATGGRYTILDSVFVSQLVNYHQRLVPLLYPSDTREPVMTDSEPDEAFSAPYTWKTEDAPLELTDDMYISTVYDIPKLENGHFFFNDMLNNGIMLFRQEGNGFRYRSFLQANDNERNKFVKIPDFRFNRMVGKGQVFYIALSANMIDDNHIGISYSLPDISGEEIDGEYNITYFNAPAILIRNVDDLRPGKMITPDFDLMHSEYFHRHFTFDIFNNRLWLGCQKLTWPMDGFTEEDVAGNVEMDPFDDGFYDTFNPIIASFDIDSGKCDGHYGKLEECQRKSKTGYYFLNEVYTHHGGDLLYGNGYTGRLYVADSASVDRPKREYTVFDIDPSSFPEPDSTKFYLQEYLSLYTPNFKRCITAVKMNDREICCLVKYGTQDRGDDFQKDRYSYIVVDRKSGESKEYPLPPIPADVKCLGYGIRNEHNAFNPFIFIKDAAGHKVRNLYLQ